MAREPMMRGSTVLSTTQLPPESGLVPPVLAGEPNKPAPNTFVIGQQDATRLASLRRDNQELSDTVVSRLSGLALEQVREKKPIEERWIEDYRRFHATYDQKTEKNLKDKGQSRAFVGITRAKTITLEARLFDLIFPTDDRNYEIKATPVPKLAKEGKEAEQRAQNAAEQATQAEAAGNTEQAQQIVAEGQVEAQRKSAADAEMAAAKGSAELMQEEMDDQLVESKYPAHSRDLIHQSCIIGSGILKGPMVGEQKRGKWVPANDNIMGATPDVVDWKMDQADDPRPLVRWVNAWAFFPDMSATRIEEAEFTFERHLWSRRDLRKMVKTHGFDPQAVRDILRETKRTTTSSPGLEYLIQLRSLTGEGTGQIVGRYVGWEYHGPLECEEVVALLRYLGREEEALAYEAEDDPLKEFRVILYFCDGKLLKISPEYPLDSGETLYSVFNIEENEGSIFGYGMSHILDSQQNALNSSWRMGIDNSGLSVGPQVLIDKDAVVPADGDWTMAPNKIWFRVKAAAPNTPAPMELFNIPNNMGEIAALIKLAVEFMDMESGISMPQQGEQGAHTTQTVGGMAILQNASNILFRRIVKNYDDGIIAPTMRRLYDWNMQFNPRAEIKGDMQVDARGASVLLVKEVQAQNLMIVVTALMANPTIQMMLKPYDAVRKLFQSMMITPSDVMVTADEFEKRQKAAAEQPPPPDPAEINAKARVESAMIQAEASRVNAETSVLIAQIRERVELIHLAQTGNLTIEELKTRLAEKQIDTDSKERMMAVEIGVERQMAQEARERGEDPSGSGGNFSAGGGDEQAREAANA